MARPSRIATEELPEEEDDAYDRIFDLLVATAASVVTGGRSNSDKRATAEGTSTSSNRDDCDDGAAVPVPLVTWFDVHVVAGGDANGRLIGTPAAVDHPVISQPRHSDDIGCLDLSRSAWRTHCRELLPSQLASGPKHATRLAIGGCAQDEDEVEPPQGEDSSPVHRGDARAWLALVEQCVRLAVSRPSGGEQHHGGGGGAVGTLLTSGGDDAPLGTARCGVEKEEEEAAGEVDASKVVPTTPSSAFQRFRTVAALRCALLALDMDRTRRRMGGLAAAPDVPAPSCSNPPRTPILVRIFDWRGIARSKPYPNGSKRFTADRGPTAEGVSNDGHNDQDEEEGEEGTTAVGVAVVSAAHQKRMLNLRRRQQRAAVSRKVQLSLLDRMYPPPHRQLSDLVAAAVSSFEPTTSPKVMKNDSRTPGSNEEEEEEEQAVRSPPNGMTSSARRSSPSVVVPLPLSVHGERWSRQGDTAGVASTTTATEGGGSGGGDGVLASKQAGTSVLSPEPDSTTAAFTTSVAANHGDYHHNKAAMSPQTLSFAVETEAQQRHLRQCLHAWSLFDHTMHLDVGPRSRESLVRMLRRIVVPPTSSGGGAAVVVTMDREAFILSHANNAAAKDSCTPSHATAAVDALYAALGSSSGAELIMGSSTMIGATTTKTTGSRRCNYARQPMQTLPAPQRRILHRHSPPRGTVAADGARRRVEVEVEVEGQRGSTLPPSVAPRSLMRLPTPNTIDERSIATRGRGTALPANAPQPRPQPMPQPHRLAWPNGYYPVADTRQQLLLTSESSISDKDPPATAGSPHRDTHSVRLLQSSSPQEREASAMTTLKASGIVSHSVLLRRSRELHLLSEASTDVVHERTGIPPNGDPALSLTGAMPAQRDVVSPTLERMREDHHGVRRRLPSRLKSLMHLSADGLHADLDAGRWL